MAADRPLIPIELLRPYIKNWIAQNESSIQAFSYLCGINHGQMSHIISGGLDRTQKPNGKVYVYEKKNVEFSTADKIITKGLGNPWLWHTDPKLNELYEQVV